MAVLIRLLKYIKTLFFEASRLFGIEYEITLASSYMRPSGIASPDFNLKLLLLTLLTLAKIFDKSIYTMFCRYNPRALSIVVYHCQASTDFIGRHQRRLLRRNSV